MRVVFNTGYYFSAPEDLTARESAAANGRKRATGCRFSSWTANRSIFKRFSVPTILFTYELGDVWVTNAQTVWEHGVLKADSDGDGLSDEFEMQGHPTACALIPMVMGLAMGSSTLSTGERRRAVIQTVTRMPPCSTETAMAFQVDGEPRGTYTDSDGDILMTARSIS